MVVDLQKNETTKEMKITVGFGLKQLGAGSQKMQKRTKIRFRSQKKMVLIYKRWKKNMQIRFGPTNYV